MSPSLYVRTILRNIFVISLFIAVAGCLPAGEADTPEETAPDTETDQQIVGSVGDGPIVAALVRIRANDGTELATVESDTSANIDVTVKTRGSQYPLRLDATSGTDLVTNAAPDFDLRSSVLKPGKRSTANINPFTTFAIDLSNDLPGGRTESNIIRGLEIVTDVLNAGLTSMSGSGVLENEVTAANIAEVLRSSEALGEAVRRTRDALLTVNLATHGNDVVDAVASDLSDGVIDGQGGPGTDPRITAVFGVAYAHVMIETMQNELRVNGVDAMPLMNAAISQVFAGEPAPGFGGLPLTSRMQEAARTGLLAANWLQPDAAFDAAIAEVEALATGMLPAEASAILVTDVTTQLANNVVLLAGASDGDINTINGVLATGSLPTANSAPQIDGSPATTVDAGALYHFEPTASDVDGDTLSFSIAGRPAWAQFDPATGVLQGVPSETNAGTYANIIITVSDGQETANLPAFTITVTVPEVNAAPTISGSPAAAIDEGALYRFVPTASDPDGDALTFSIAGKPAWAAFDTGTGELSGIPGPADVGVHGGIVITVSDGDLEASLPAFSITVSALFTNTPPVISGSPATSVSVDAFYDFVPQAQDADGDALSFSISGRPGWASFDASTGRLSGTPLAGDVGNWTNITISVSDGQVSDSLAPFAIEVVEAASNAAPTISGSPASVVVVGTAYQFTPTANDADGDALTFSISGLPSWASFSTANGSISGTPGAGDVGTYANISITVSDGTDSATLGPFSISVEDVVLGSATLSWTPPTQNTDGTPLTDLAGFRIYWGTEQGNYTESVTLDNPGLTTYVVDNLAPGTWYFVSTALNSNGVESDYSNSAAKLIQ